MCSRTRSGGTSRKPSFSAATFSSANRRNSRNPSASSGKDARPAARSGQSTCSSRPARWMAVLGLHRLGQGREIGGALAVVLVVHEHRDDARRCGREEGLSGAGISCGDLQHRDVSLDGSGVGVGHRAPARGDLYEVETATARHRLRVLGEAAQCRVAAWLPPLDRLEPREPPPHVRDIADLGSSPSLTTSRPVSTCRRTQSATDSRTPSGSSSGPPRSRSTIAVSSSAGRGRLPVCVVLIRLIRFPPSIRFDLNRR